MTPDAIEREEGGWSIQQVLTWISTRDIATTRRHADSRQRAADILYPTHDRQFPQKREEETTEAFASRSEQFETSRTALGRAARNMLFSALQAGKLAAFDPSKDVHNRHVDRAVWQTLTMTSPEARRFRFSAHAVQQIWRAQTEGVEARQARANNWMLNHFQAANAQSGSKPSRDSAIKDCQRAVGARYREARAAYGEVPAGLKNPRYRQQRKSGN